MTLCQKLEELGYECDNPFFRHCKYYYDINVLVGIILDSVGEEIRTYGVITDDALYKQDGIDKMQVAFNRLKKDIKEIEKWQKQIANLSK